MCTVAHSHRHTTTQAHRRTEIHTGVCPTMIAKLQSLTSDYVSQFPAEIWRQLQLLLQSLHPFGDGTRERYRSDRLQHTSPGLVDRIAASGSWHSRQCCEDRKDESLSDFSVTAGLARWGVTQQRGRSMTAARRCKQRQRRRRRLPLPPKTSSRCQM